MKAPLLLLHGAHRGRAGLWPTALWLRRRGFDARAFGYATRRDSLQVHAQRLAEFLDGWLGDRSEPARERLDVLTHSMGALVIRRYLKDYGQVHAQAHRVVMLGPPNQGASLASNWEGRRIFNWVYGEAAKEVMPRKAQELGPLPTHAEGLVLAGGRGERGYHPFISGDDDGVVALVDTYLQGAAHELVGGVHSTLQWRPAVLRRAIRFFAEGR